MVASVLSLQPRARRMKDTSKQQQSWPSVIVGLPAPCPLPLRLKPHRYPAYDAAVLTTCSVYCVRGCVGEDGRGCGMVLGAALKS